MTEPNYWDEKLYVIRGDATELKRHVLLLADDLTFCTGHEAVRALEQFDESARSIYGGVKRTIKTSLTAAARQVQLRPAVSVVIGFACVAVLTAVISRPKHLAARCKAV